MPEGLTLRDYFAAHASDADVDSLRHTVPKVQMFRSGYAGHRLVAEGCEPRNWRQLARYIHADRMLSARAANMDKQNYPSTPADETVA